MATIKYLIQSQSESAPIYLRFSESRKNVIKRKTGLIWDKSKWNVQKGTPIGTTTEAKRLKKELRDLKAKVIDAYDKDYPKGVLINGDWLQNVIADKFERETTQDFEKVVVFGEYFIKQLKYKVTKGKKGVSKSTEQKYRTIVNKLIGFEDYSKKSYLVRDVDLKFRSRFIDYLAEVHKLGDNTIGRYLKFVKSICLEAQRNDVKTHKQLEHFKGFTVKAPKVTLSFAELQKIKDAILLNEKHQIARDWLIIGCYTGQRISDLMRMNSSIIQSIQNFNFIVLDQIKTGKRVQIPIHHEVKAVLDKRNGEFPPIYTKSADSHKTLFNRYLKELCLKAEINTLVEGNLYDQEKERYVRGEYEKHKVIASHVCRRSFATNFYGNPKYPTPILMNITAHSTEEMFLEYIGKKPIDYGVQLAQIWATESAKVNGRVPTMAVLKDASNQ